MLLISRWYDNKRTKHRDSLCLRGKLAKKDLAHLIRRTKGYVNRCQEFICQKKFLEYVSAFLVSRYYIVNDDEDDLPDDEYNTDEDEDSDDEDGLQDWGSPLNHKTII